jgi:hypothetical protein
MMTIFIAVTDLLLHMYPLPVPKERTWCAQLVEALRYKSAGDRFD